MDMDWESMRNPWETDGNPWKSMDKLMEHDGHFGVIHGPKDIFVQRFSYPLRTDFEKIGGRFRQQMLENSPDVCAMGHGVISGVTLLPLYVCTDYAEIQNARRRRRGRPFHIDDFMGSTLW